MIDNGKEHTVSLSSFTWSTANCSVSCWSFPSTDKQKQVHYSSAVNIEYFSHLSFEERRNELLASPHFCSSSSLLPLSKMTSPSRCITQGWDRVYFRLPDDEWDEVMWVSCWSPSLEVDWTVLLQTWERVKLQIVVGLTVLRSKDRSGETNVKIYLSRCVERSGGRRMDVWKWSVSQWLSSRRRRRRPPVNAHIDKWSFLSNWTNPLPLTTDET